jgi:uridylate kinase
MMVVALLLGAGVTRRRLLNAGLGIERSTGDLVGIWASSGNVWFDAGVRWRFTSAVPDLPLRFP